MMFKHTVLMILSFWMVACSAHDKHYYIQHPEVLKTALVTCEAKPADPVNCNELNHIAVRLNELALQLRMDPQAYGQQILALQQTIAHQKIALQQDTQQADLQATLNKNKQALVEYLAVVKWLASPER